MKLLAVTGLKREARIVEGPGVVAVSGGGNADNLARLIADALQDDVKGIVSFGVAGALAPGLVPGDIIFATEVIDGGRRVACDQRWSEAMKARVPFAHRAPMAGSSTIIADGAAKAALYRTTGAAAVDMESHIAARAAQAHGLPFVTIRTISDAADHALPPAALAAMKPDGGIDVLAVTRSVLANPGQIPALIRTGRESEKAFASLFRSLDALGRGLACPDLG